MSLWPMTITTLSVPSGPVPARVAVVPVPMLPMPEPVHVLLHLLLDCSALHCTRRYTPPCN